MKQLINAIITASIAAATLATVPAHAENVKPQDGFPICAGAFAYMGVTATQLGTPSDTFINRFNVFATVGSQYVPEVKRLAGQQMGMYVLIEQNQGRRVAIDQASKVMAGCQVWGQQYGIKPL
jgi:hypothetical protein